MSGVPARPRQRVPGTAVLGAVAVASATAFATIATLVTTAVAEQGRPSGRHEIVTGDRISNAPMVPGETPTSGGPSSTTSSGTPTSTTTGTSAPPTTLSDGSTPVPPPPPPGPGQPPAGTWLPAAAGADDHHAATADDHLGPTAAAQHHLRSLESQSPCPLRAFSFSRCPQRPQARSELRVL